MDDTALTFTFTTNNINAVGGDFFVTGVSNVLLNGTVTLSFSDGTVRTVASSTGGASFLGYIADAPLTSLAITGVSTETHT